MLDWPFSVLSSRSNFVINYSHSSWKRQVLAALLLTGSLSAAAQAAPQALSPGLGVPVGSVTLGPVARMIQLPGHIPSLVQQSTPLGAYQTSAPLSFTVALPLRRTAAMQDLLQGLYDPSDARYGHYLKPGEFGDQFGPTQAQYDAVVSYLQSKGVTISQTHPERTTIDVSGTLTQIRAAFGVTLRNYRAPDGRMFHAPMTEVVVPLALQGSIVGVAGLDDANVPTPLAMPRPVSQTGDDVQPAVEQGSGLGGGFIPRDLKRAYGLDTLALDGTGQTTAMIEFGTDFNQKDILKYARAAGLTKIPPIVVIPIAGGTRNFTGNSTETVLDIDMQIAIAPNAAQVLVYEDPGNIGLIAGIQQIATEDRAQQVSISYGFGSESASRTTLSPTQIALNATFTQMSIQGQSVYVSSGDSGSSASRTNGSPTSVDQLGSEPMICCVGGTSLFVQSPGTNEAYKSETTWNFNGTPSGGAGGGGISRLWPIPFYQTNAANAAAAIPGSNVSTTNRNIPDISLVADPNTGVLIYSSVDPGSAPGYFIEGGTSASAPLMAGYTALINQNRARNGMAPIGLLNFSIYPAAYTSGGLTPTYTSLFHDIADGSSNNTVKGGLVFTAVKGFDDSTGLGTIQGASLLVALSGPAPTVTSIFGSQEARMPTRRASLRLAQFGLPSAASTVPARRLSLLQ